jgi:predicted RNA-binding Zn ribbon-like protein
VSTYSGPIRGEPLAVELHNTLYAVGRQVIDGLETVDGLSAWLAAIADRLPDRARDADPSRHQDFLDLREAVREALHANLDGRRISRQALRVINDFAAGAPVSPRAVEGPEGRLRVEAHRRDADPTDVALATVAADAIELVAGSGLEELRACRAPNCVLMFIRDNPRRRWCSAACGNRARQARHYERVRATRGVRRAGRPRA